MKRHLHSAAALLLAAVVAVPVFAARGSADFSNFVALGDSYGAGFESNSLNERHQVWSWPAIIARQAGLTLCPASATAADNCFAQPLVSYPGLILVSAWKAPRTGGRSERLWFGSTANGSRQRPVSRRSG